MIVLFLCTTLNGRFVLCLFIEIHCVVVFHILSIEWWGFPETLQCRCITTAFVVMLFIVEYVPCAGEYRGNRFTCPSISFCSKQEKKRPRWPQLKGRWFPASLFMEMQYEFRFLSMREHSETETCPESTSKETLCIFKLAVEKNLIYGGILVAPIHRQLVVTIVRIAIIIATTITFCFLGK
jgi:hypothetical protein